jgi:CRP-like cAMP-binding protein
VTNKMPQERQLQSRVSVLNSGSHHPLTYIIQNVLRGDLNEEDKVVLNGIEEYCKEVMYTKGEPIFQRNTHSDAFYIVTRGIVAVPKRAMPSTVISGAGAVRSTRNLSSPDLTFMGEDGHSTTIESFHKVGGIFGYCDYLLGRHRTFDAVAQEGTTVVVRFTRANMDRMKEQDRALFVIIQNLLLNASLMDLANCTCHN